MESAPRNKPLLKKLMPLVSVAGVSTLVLVLVYASVFRPLNGIRSFFGSDVGGTASSLFANLYPANDRFREELDQLRVSGKLKPENELLIQRSVSASAQSLKMPPAVLWCLLFQESRLNHLEGFDETKGASGIGQFSSFSFFEINHQIDRFNKDNLNMMTEILGKDVRPVEARKSDLFHSSSYYSIPTAVVSSAAFLNNRYLQLERILKNHGIPFSKDLLWLQAAMAYNKGTRSVLSLWNQSRKRYGSRSVEKLVLESETLFSRLDDLNFVTASLAAVWPPSQAMEYARELKTHMSNIRECTVDPSAETGFTRPKEIQ